MTVEVRYLGGFGNNLFQYAFGRILAENLGRELVCVSNGDAPLFRLAPEFPGAPQQLPGRSIEYPQLRFTSLDRPLWDQHGVDLADLRAAGADKRIVLAGYFQRAAYYAPHRARIRRWFAPSNGSTTAPTIEPEDILVQIRRGDYFQYGSAIDLTYYERILDDLQPGRVFVSGVGIDDEVRQRLGRFDPHWLEAGPLTLRTATRFSRMVLPNSSFSWWCAFLSDAARIYFPRPRAGYWSKETSRIALELEDPRYVYVDAVEVATWRPFTPRWSRLTIHTDEPPAPARELTMVLTSPDGRTVPLDVEERLRPLCAWLGEQRQPFGPSDFAHLSERLPAGSVATLFERLIGAQLLLVRSDDQPTPTTMKPAQ